MKLWQLRASISTHSSPQRQRRVRPEVERLEARDVPSALGLDNLVAHPFVVAHPLGSGGPGLPAFYPSDIRQAYGISGISGNGSGQTIAIIDAYNDPKIKSDLASFDSSFGLPAPPSFRVVNQSGGTRLPRNSPPGSWDVEESLDVEWAHAVAPGASLILVEANSPTYVNLINNAVNWARSQTGVSVISMSFGGGEFSGETGYDGFFTTPSGHNGVTFVASTGDSGKPGGFPAYSPNVLAVGGTSLTLDSNSNWVSESGWSSGGGGTSTVESKPSYQNGVNSTSHRQIPDISFDADPNTGVYVLDTYAGGAFQVGGTSLSAPCWGGLLAIANQLRHNNGFGTLQNTAAQSKLYGLPSGDFHDITSGNNGYAAGPGYDLVTGIGSPIANLLVPALASSALGPSQVGVPLPSAALGGSGVVGAHPLLAGNLGGLVTGSASGDLATAGQGQTAAPAFNSGAVLSSGSARADLFSNPAQQNQGVWTSADAQVLAAVVEAVATDGLWASDL